MVSVIVLRHPNTGKYYLENACNYLYKKEYVYIGGFGIDFHDRKYVYKQMMRIKKHFGKTSGNQVIHIMVSFDMNTVYDEKTAIEKGKKIAELFSEQYQLVWGIHKLARDNSIYHMHIIINSVSFIDGKMFDSGLMNMKVYCVCIKQITQDNKYYLEFKSEE